jgi:hypothetical protein
MPIKEEEELHVPKNFPTRVPWSSISNNSNNILLQNEYCVSVGRVSPKDYTTTYNGVKV